MATLAIPPQERSPLAVNGVYNAGAVGPHAATVRVTYTVPAGRRTIIEAVSASIIRETVAAPVGRVSGVWALVPSGGASGQILRVTMLGNVVADNVHEVAFGAIWLLAGDVFTFTTVDVGTGGTIRYDAGFKGTEFDA